MIVKSIQIQAGGSQCTCGSCPQCTGGAVISAAEIPGHHATGKTDSVDISDEGKKLGVKSSENDGTNEKGADGKPLSEEESDKVRELEKRDREVRSHEMAHASAGAGIAMGGPVYKLEKGPDGNSYAVAGHVKLDTGKENTPEATIAKMQQIKRAALAPANPSGTDRQVAAQAARKESDARSEASETDAEKMEKSQNSGKNASKSNPLESIKKGGHTEYQDIKNQFDNEGLSNLDSGVNLKA